MYFVNHNFTDTDFETKHMNRIEKTVYFDLRSLYLSAEKPIDGSDMDLLQRRLSVTDDDEKAALAFVLKDKFSKAGKYYKRAAWDKILKDYKWGNKNKGNATRNAVTNDVTNDVTHGVTYGVTYGNAACNVTCNDDDDAPLTPAERTRKSRQDKRHMINALTNIGLTVDKDIKTADLRELYATHADSITSNVTSDVTQTVTPSNDDCNASHAKNAAITNNQEPRTTNQEPLTNINTQDWRDEKFEEFYKIYPNKKSKGQAKITWNHVFTGNKLHDKPENPEALFQQIVAAAKDQTAKIMSSEETFRKHPSTWLNAQAWLDEVAPQQPQSSASRERTTPDPLAVNAKYNVPTEMSDEEKHAWFAGSTDSTMPSDTDSDNSHDHYYG